MQWILISAGGALGAVARFWLSQNIYQVTGKSFAWGTLSVNIIGSFLIGFVAFLMLNKFSYSDEIRSFVIVGFLGAFTTFSTFSLETVQYIEVGDFSKAFLNISVSVITCLLAVAVGLWLCKQFVGE